MRTGRRRRRIGKCDGAFECCHGGLPDLKANTNMMQLTEELTTTENKVAFSRQAFNDQVTGVQHLPRILSADTIR